MKDGLTLHVSPKDVRQFSTYLHNAKAALATAMLNRSDGAPYTESLLFSVAQLLEAVKLMKLNIPKSLEEATMAILLEDA